MCECIKQTNAALEPHNAIIDVGFRIDISTGESLPPHIGVPLSKLDGKKKGKLPVLFAAFCPICGKRYEQ